MANLGDLHRAIISVIDAGGGYKVFFYASDGDGYGVRHGFVGIVPDSRCCEISFERMDNESALREIPRLSFLKVHTLAMAGSSPLTGANPTLEISHLLNLLDPALRPAPAPSAVTAAAAAAAPVPMPHPGNGAAISSAEKEAAAVRLAHIQLQRKATDLLKQLYGNSAGDKVSAIANKHSPVAQSEEFLTQCEQLAQVILGENRARELFQPLRRLISP